MIQYDADLIAYRTSRAVLESLEDFMKNHDFELIERNYADKVTHLTYQRGKRLGHLLGKVSKSPTTIQVEYVKKGSETHIELHYTVNLFGSFFNSGNQTIFYHEFRALEEILRTGRTTILSAPLSNAGDEFSMIRNMVWASEFIFIVALKLAGC